MSIKIEDLKVGAEFLDSCGSHRIVKYTGDKFLISAHGDIEDSINISFALENWNYPEPKNPRTVEFFEWIDNYGQVDNMLITKEGKTRVGGSHLKYNQIFLAWSGRSFMLEVSDDWGVSYET